MDGDGNYANVGGGSPKLSWTESDEYQVTFTRLVDDKTYAFTAQWSDPTGRDMLQDGSAKVSSATKQYKISEQVIKPGDDTRLGLALIGVEVEITNLTLINEDGEVMYEQPKVDGLDTLSLTGEDETVGRFTQEVDKTDKLIIAEEGGKGSLVQNADGKNSYGENSYETLLAGVMTIADSKENDQAVQNMVTKVELYIYNGKTLVDVVVLNESVG